MSIDLAEIRRVLAEADCLATADEVDAALDRMAEGIAARLADSNPLCYCVMNGGLVIAGRLLSRLPFPLEVAYLHATRYGHEPHGTTMLDWRVRPTQDLVGRTVLVIDDILDEGHTLEAIVAHCKEEGAAEVLTAVLVHKLHDRKVRPDIRPDFHGLDLPDRYLFGCGMDYKGYWRNAPGIYALKNH